MSLELIGAIGEHSVIFADMYFKNIISGPELESLLGEKNGKMIQSLRHKEGESRKHVSF